MNINGIELTGILVSFALVLSYQFPRLGRLALLRPPLALGLLGFAIFFGEYMLALVSALPILVWIVQIWRSRKTLRHMVQIEYEDTETMVESTQADTIASLKWLKKHMVKRYLKKGTVIFKKGDQSDAMYLITKGKVRLEEINVVLGAGEMIGEIGIFSPTGARTATASCDTNCELLYLSARAALEQFTLDTEFALRILRLIIARMNQRLAKNI